MKRTSLVAIGVAVVLAVIGLSAVYLLRPIQAALLDCTPTCFGTVDKRPEELFTVKVAFANTGTREGAWNVSVAFEGDAWTWTGERRRLTLEPGEKVTVTWSGTVPAEALEGSTARLVVYYADAHKALNWWIHVAPGAELAVVDSQVT